MKEKVALAAAIAVALFLRVYDIEVMPAWDWDEGVNLNIASNLAEGRAQQFALKYVWIPHPPLYFIAALPAMELLGKTIASLRLLSIAYSIATLILVYLIGKKLDGGLTGVTAAFFYAIYPAAVFWNRMGFAHNQLMLLATTALYLLINKRAGNRIYFASAAVFLCFITEYSGAAFIAAVLAHTLIYRREEFNKAALITATLVLAYTAVMVYLYGGWFLQDLQFNFGRVNAVAFALAAAIAALFLLRPQKLKQLLGWFHMKADHIGLNVFLFYLPLTLLAVLIPPTTETMLDPISYFWVAGAIGLLFIADEEKRDTMWLFYLSYLAMLGVYNRADHMAVPLYPILSIGAAVFLLKLASSRERITAAIRGAGARKAAAAISLALIFYPAAVVTLQDISGFASGSNFRATPLSEMQKLNEFINANTVAGDIVLTQSYLSQGLECRTTILLHAIAYDGQGIAYYPPLNPERFAYNTSIANLRYAVLPEHAVEALNQSGYAEAAEELSRWRVVYETQPEGDAGVPVVYSFINEIKGVEYDNAAPTLQVLENPRKPTG